MWFGFVSFGLKGVVQALPLEAVGRPVPPGARDAGLSRGRVGGCLQHRGIEPPFKENLEDL